MTPDIPEGFTLIDLAELHRLMEIAEAARYAVTQQGDDVCWMDLYVKFADLLGVPFEPKMLPRERMLANCTRFVDSLLQGCPYVPSDPPE